MTDAIPNPVANTIAAVVGDVRSFSFVSGGCINHGGRLTTSRGDYFLKWNSKETFPRMFEKESQGLRILAATGSIRVPNVIAVGDAEHYQYIVLELINASRPNAKYWENFGGQLASLHRNTAPAFGLDHDNYIGSLPQSNRQHEKWNDFFIHQRLVPQLQLALRQGKLSSSVATRFESLFQQLPSILPDEPPALLHGDLWSGNLITDDRGMPCLIDPAVHYGHREAEIAFTNLFGGFADTFYHAYNENFPLMPGFDERLDVYNLYPLLVHVNLFGGGYAQQVVSILARFV